MTERELGSSFRDEVEALVRARLAAGAPGPGRAAELRDRAERLAPLAPLAPLANATPAWGRPYVVLPPREPRADGVELSDLCALGAGSRAAVLSLASAAAARLLPLGSVREALSEASGSEAPSVPALRHLGRVLDKHLARALGRGVAPHELPPYLVAELLSHGFCGRFRCEGDWLAAHLEAPTGPLLARRLSRRDPDPLARSGARALLLDALRAQRGCR